MLRQQNRISAPSGRDKVPDINPPVDLPTGVNLGDLRDRWTAEGQMVLRTCRIPLPAEERMRILWRNHREDFIRRGFSLKSENDVWHLNQWLKPYTTVNGGAQGIGYELTHVGQEILNSLLAPEELPIIFDPETLNLSALPPELEAKLFDYQVDPARQLFRAVTHGQEEWGYPGAWDCSDLGVGKTFQSLAAALATGLEVGVICPMSVMESWRSAFRHFGQCPRFIRNYESLRTGKRDYVKIEKYPMGQCGDNGEMTYGKRFSWTLEPRDTLLIWDECHRLKNTGTKSQALAIAAIRQRFPMICVSGTLASDPTHMRATGRVVGLHQGGESWLPFLVAHGCTAKGKKVTSKGIKFMAGPRGRKVLARIHHTVFPQRGARTRIADLGDRFPETQIIAEMVDTGETQKIVAGFVEAQKVIDQMEKDGMAEGKVESMRQMAYMKAFHNSERCKVASICEIAEDEIEEGRSVAIFVNFTDTREAIMERLKTTCGIYGGQDPWHRDQCIAKFQRDESRVIVSNISAGGVGVSLHDVQGNFPRTAIILPTNRVIDLMQALGRVHRAGGKSRSRQLIVYASGCLEENICRNVRAKMSQISSLNDGDLNPAHKF